MSVEQQKNRYGFDATAGLGADTVQYSTFVIAGRLYGIDVTRVQEVVRPMLMTRIPLAPNYIVGLINLRGQVATAIGLRELFGLPAKQTDNLMNVVCKTSGALLSFLVDEIGDVIEVKKSDYESPPSTIAPNVRKFISGVYKTTGTLLSVIDIEPIAKHLDVGKKTSEAKASA